MHYNVHRSYKWNVGGYMQNDPLGLGGGWNRRTYVDSNPLGFSDPKGLLKICAIPGGCIDTNPPPLVGPDYPYPMSTPPSLPSIWSPVIAIPSAIMNGCKALTDWMLNRFPDRNLPRDPYGNPVPDPEAEGPYTQLGQKDGRNGSYDQAREFDANGRPVRDIDFTDHGRPNNHPNPHQHDYLPNGTGGTPQRGPTRPLN